MVGQTNYYKLVIQLAFKLDSKGLTPISHQRIQSLGNVESEQSLKHKTE